MPVIATPVVLEPVLYVVSPRITQVYDQRIPTKRRSVVVKQGQYVAVQMAALDDLGNPVDLALFENGRVRARFAEAVGGSGAGDESMGDILDTADGLVVFPVPGEVTQTPGVYDVECAVLDAADRMYFSNTIFMVVERGLFVSPGGAPSGRSQGPPTLDELRLSMRDNGPEDNRLLDDYEFDAAELAWALVRSVQLWNTVPPPISLFYDTTTFPFRDLWIEGVCGQLFEMAANRYMRNDLQYSAGGVTVADQSKWQQYYAAGQRRWQTFLTEVKSKKVSVNMGIAMGDLGAPYGRYTF